jgi:hypothetical protein
MFPVIKSRTLIITQLMCMTSMPLLVLSWLMDHWTKSANKHGKSDVRM